MKQLTRFSAVPIGEKFEYNGKIYTRSSYGRGKGEKDTFVYFKKHEYVIWLNPWPTQVEV